MYKFLNQIQLRFISCFEHFVVIGLDAAGSFYCFDAINKTVPYSNDPKLNEWTNEWTSGWMNEWMKTYEKNMLNDWQIYSAVKLND